MILFILLLSAASISLSNEQSPGPPANVSAPVVDYERASFLEWLTTLISGEEEDVTPPPPVSADECETCSQYSNNSLKSTINTTTTTTKCQLCKCGIANKKTRIVGGQLTYVNQYPWMALLMYNKRFYCGGSLLNSRYVLTAAHCVHQFNKKKISVRLLEHDRDIDNDTMHIDRGVKRIIKHSGYSDRTFNNDIAIIQLEEDLELEGEPGLRPVCLPPSRFKRATIPNCHHPSGYNFTYDIKIVVYRRTSKEKSFSGHHGVVTGWGVRNAGGSTSPTLHEVSVPIMTNKACRNTSYGEKRITDNMMCAGYPEGKKDSCQGDSGGPLHVVNETRYDIVGVVSWGEGCALADHPGVYTRVNRYLTWIRRNTQDSCYCQVFEEISHKNFEGAGNGEVDELTEK